MASFGFDDVVNVEQHEGGYKLLTPGPARFVVREFKRGFFGGSDKIGPCPQAELALLVTDQRGESTTVPVRIPLDDKLAWKITSLFQSCGLLPENVSGNVRYPWAQLEGTHGQCVIAHSTWRGRDGQERKSNDLARFVHGPEAQFHNIVQD